MGGLLFITEFDNEIIIGSEAKIESFIDDKLQLNKGHIDKQRYLNHEGYDDPSFVLNYSNKYFGNLKYEVLVFNGFLGD